ncbi:MoaD/ThiS family protein [Actinokineospora diospyrosa]|uniref:Molybdopterin converting factor, small subunit n=1 Tax=Actinokineospora diospyrosa TaxID=103728 RepID=A0ABT1IGS3_9PSEU|nr:MoaD/ThiS family protein [Actinokineospora diospyrosa]MCP2271838.1 Molybdopterin converting factor, small subunit [Actinokineospora diospyrosa]
MGLVTVRYFAGARAAAGVHEEKVELPTDATVQDALTAIATLHGDVLGRVMLSASFLLDGVAVRDRAARLPEGTALDVLPPFAGG